MSAARNGSDRAREQRAVSGHGDRLQPVTWFRPRVNDELPDEPAARRSRPGWGRLVAPVLVAGAVLLKLAGSLKFLGIFVSVGGYALIWGWRFAVGFVLLILVHELGHYLEARRQGLNPQLPVFIPFLGAYVALRGQPFDPWRNALRQGLQAVADFQPGALVVALGLDTFEADPISGFKLRSADYLQVGADLAAAGLPTVFVFEGGYAVAELGVNAVNVLEGFLG